MQMFNRRALGIKSGSNNIYMSKSGSNNFRMSWSYVWLCSLAKDIYRSRGYSHLISLTSMSWSV